MTALDGVVGMELFQEHADEIGVLVADHIPYPPLLPDAGLEGD